MIWIIDNGGEFSDHVVAFVEMPANFDMVAFLTAVADRDYAIASTYSEQCKREEFVDWHVLASAPEITWHEGEPNMAIGAIGRQQWRDDYPDFPLVKWEDFLR